MKTDLDRDLSLSLEEPAPGSSARNMEALHAHDARIRREEQGFLRREEKAHRISLCLYRMMAVLAAVCIILILLWGVTDLPVFGGETNPAENEVAGRYLAQGLAEGGATNLVSNMILDYRAFDTLGESNVLFTAACTVLLLLHVLDKKKKPLHAAPAVQEAPSDPILQAGAKALFPMILLYGLYIILNGHLGPGGGFSGGSVLGASMTLFSVAFGRKSTARFMSARIYNIIRISGLCIYGVMFGIYIFFGANAIESDLSRYIVSVIDIAVGLVVMTTMYGFYSFYTRGEL